MSQTEVKDLRYVENLRREGKLQEALKAINEIEKKGTLTQGDQLSLLISKGKTYTLLQNFPESARIGELAYRLSKGLERVPDMIMALIFRANMVMLGESDEPLAYLSEAEDLLNTLDDKSSSYISRRKAHILYRKAMAHMMGTNYEKALEEAFECLEIQEKMGRKADAAYTYQELGEIYYRKNELDLSLEYLSKGLEKFEELGDQIGKAWILSILGRISNLRGDLNKALGYCKESLSIKPINNLMKHNNYMVLAQIYFTKGELDRALRYFNRLSSLQESLNLYPNLINNKIIIGLIYVAKGEYKLAIEILKSGLKLCKEINFPRPITNALLGLMLIYYQTDSKEQLQDCLDQLKEHNEKYKDVDVIGYQFGLNGYRVGKAWLLIKSGRSHNRAEAENLLKQVIQKATLPLIYQMAISELFDFYLEELQLFNEPEILEELNPLIEQLLIKAKEQNLYWTLGEAKLLQAKLALIKLNFEDAQRLLTQAQHLAEFNGLNFLAQRISSEHDNYLEKLNEWKNLKEKDAPMEERLELASVGGVIERLQGRRAIEPPELIEEEPIVLLIMDKSGISYFTYSFRENWDFDMLFSSFMSAFDSFSSEVFAESIDRIKIGENLILINPVEPFLVCYVIKGQSYPGLQKLTRFSNAIKENSEIWERLKKAVQTGEVLEINNPQVLGNVVNEIFTK
ncbi:MAG: tetratricopeptide repeat protein [Candidatus Thorarchaeota archaeon]